MKKVSSYSCNYRHDDPAGGTIRLIFSDASFEDVPDLAPGPFTSLLQVLAINGSVFWDGKVLATKSIRIEDDGPNPNPIA